MYRSLSIIFLLCSIFAFATVGVAQSIPADISLETIPLDPQAGSTVTIKATSYGVDLTQANLVWSYNNKIIGSGIGKTSITITAPASGAVGTITLTVSGAGFDATTSTLTLRPGSVDVLWEAVDAYTPPFYKGKALLPTGGLLRATAIPAPTAPKGVSYSWTENGSALPDLSGYGKSSIVFRHNALNGEENISVSAIGGLFTGTGSIRITPIDPSIVVYQNKEGFVDYTTGYTQDATLNQPGAVLRFEPYYFSTPRGVQNDLSFNLQVNDTTLSNQDQPNELRFSQPGNGIAQIKALITTVRYSLQNAQKAFTIRFN